MDQERSAVRELSRPAPAAAQREDGARVGRDGRLRLDFVRRGAATVAVERRFQTPLQVLAPIAFPDDPALGIVLLNPTGGVLGGDHLDTELRLGAGSHVVVTTPSATRVYGGRVATARLATRVAMAAGSTLEYVPDHLIPHPGARLEQHLLVDMAPGAHLLLWDAWALGRPARGELWTFDRLANVVRIQRNGRAVFVDRAALGGGPRLDDLGGTEGHAYVASWLAVSDETRDWAALARVLADTVAALPRVRSGASPLAGGGVLVRLLAGNAPALLDAQRLLWACTRARCLSLGPLDLRKG